MLPIKRRIKKELFPRIAKEGSFVHGDNFYFRLLENKDEKPSLFAFVVSAKVKNTSVGRHLIKRQLSAVIEGVLETIRGGFYCIVYVKNDVSHLPHQAIKKEIIKLLEKARLLK